MKTLLCVLVGLSLSAGVASANAGLSAVPFEVGKQQFRAGDSIVIDQVLASSPKPGVGDTVTVRGHYQLASATKALLGLFVTHPTPAKADPVAPSQKARIEGPAGAFELSCTLTYEGELHVSFYPIVSGESFGGVYIK